MEHIYLKGHSSYHIGGPAAYFYEATNETAFLNALAETSDKPVFILGGGTNLLFDDAGFDGYIIKPKLTQIEVRGTNIHAGAGTSMADIVATATEAGLSGLEWAGGLPGTLGGAIRGNAGAFGGETKDSVLHTRSIDVTARAFIERDGADCRFAYRTSIFKEKKGGEVIMSAVLGLQRGDTAKIKEAVDEKIRYRNERHPMEYPNAGSVFKNVDARMMSEDERKPFAHVLKQDPFPVIPTAFLIAEAGLKGVSYGGAMISPKHPNFIVNVLDATATDVRALIELVRGTIREKFNITLEEEIMFV